MIIINKFILTFNGVIFPYCISKHVYQAMCSRTCKHVFSSTRWTICFWKYFKIVWERGSRTCKSTKHFTHNKATYNMLFFSGFSWDGCKSDPYSNKALRFSCHLSLCFRNNNFCCSSSILTVFCGFYLWVWSPWIPIALTCCKREQKEIFSY